MALRFVDSFDHYATADLASKWTSVTSMTVASGGRNGTSKLTSTNTNNSDAKKVLDAQATWIVGFAFSFSGAHVSNKFLVRFVDGTTEHVDLRMTTSNLLFVTRNGTTLGTGTTALSSSVFYYLELKVTISDTVGVVNLKINGNTELNLTSQDTRNAGNASADTIFIAKAGVDNNGATSNWDDFYVCDSTGSVNNDFLGDVRVQAILPSGAGNTTQWTPSAGSNFQNVDDTTPNGDTDYNSTSTATNKDTYAFGDLTPTSGSIKGLQWLAYVRKDDAGARTVAPVYRSTSDFDGTTQSVLDSYVYLREIKELNPNTSAAWTISEVNAAEFGIKLIA